jgi:predicted porin
MVNVIDDGKNTTAYFVDNDVSNTRVRFVGTAEATDDLTIGSRIEYAVTSNESGDVNQDNESAGDFFNVRWADLTLTSKRFGKLWLGRGDTASNNTSEVDLSKVDVLAYASVADPAAGMLFRESGGNNSLTTIAISDAFNDRDGLSRRSRVRYDTPTFWGFHLAGSLVEDQRSDASIWWGGQAWGFKAAAAAAVADPNDDSADLQYNGSFSILHEGTGLNLTAAAGMLDRDDEGDPTNFYGKLGWLANLFSVGQTGFGVDYTRSLNLPTGRDDGYSVGAVAVQQFDQYGTEFYLGYRLYSLDRDVAPSVEDLHVGTVGARVKF